jgi:hypothetical protein
MEHRIDNLTNMLSSISFFFKSNWFVLTVEADLISFRSKAKSKVLRVSLTCQL